MYVHNKYVFLNTFLQAHAALTLIDTHLHLEPGQHIHHLIGFPLWWLLVI